MSVKRLYRIEEAARRIGAEECVIFEFIRKDWLQPAQRDPEIELDEEDLARARLITELLEDFGVNDPSVPIILHLLDQLHRLHWEARKRA